MIDHGSLTMVVVMLSLDGETNLSCDYLDLFFLRILDHVSLTLLGQIHFMVAFQGKVYNLLMVD